jgi:hypothetical protein
VIGIGRFILNRHPDGEKICDYLEHDTYFLGRFLIPEQYKAQFRDKARLAKYSFFVRRGLPIPSEIKPKGEETVMKRRIMGELNAPFQPQITLNMDPENGKVEERPAGSPINCIFAFVYD